jgi:hypothetical protein
MNYQLIYYKLIKHRKDCLYEGVGELHHIVPKCVGGDDSADNIVKLSLREHFFAHLLLAKIFPNNPKILTAIFYMSNNGKYSSKEYSWMKNLYMSNGSCHKGKTYEQIMGEAKSKDLKKLRSDALVVLNSLGIVGGKGDDNPMSKKRSGKSDEYYSEKSKKAYQTRRLNGNIKQSDETRNKIKSSCKNINKKPVYIYNENKELIIICHSLKEASTYLGRSYTKLSSWIKHNSNKLLNNSYYVRYSEI